MSSLYRPGERGDDELIPDFDWVRRVTIVISYDSETDTVVIDRGSLGLTMVQAIIEKALSEPCFTDDEEYAADEDE